MQVKQKMNKIQFKSNNIRFKNKINSNNNTLCNKIAYYLKTIEPLQPQLILKIMDCFNQFQLIIKTQDKKILKIIQVTLRFNMA